MNKAQISGIIAVIVLIGIIGVFVLANPSIDDTEFENNEKFAPKENTTSSDNLYGLATSDFPSSGPFRIDKSQYLIGENIFFTADNLASTDKGRVIFLRPMNDTHNSAYSIIPFDGSSKNSFNQYFKPTLSHGKKICTTDDLVGSWMVIFEGTNYQSISFRIIDSFLLGEEKYYKDTC